MFHRIMYCYECGFPHMTNISCEKAQQEKDEMIALHKRMIEEPITDKRFFPWERESGKVS